MNKRIEFKALGGPEVLKVVEAAKPVPGSKEVLVRLHANGLNRAEYMFFKGT
ncbi:MAG: hypothetical protein AAF598_12195 [Bacteroidota bacterium]